MAKPSIVEAINAYNSPAAIVEYFNGSTKRAAEALGITQRSVQRYLQGTRKPNAAVRAKLRQAGRQGHEGTGVTFDGNVKVNGYERDRTIDRIYSPDEWDELSELAASGDEDACWDWIASEYGVSSMEVEDGDILVGEE